MSNFKSARAVATQNAPAQRRRSRSRGADANERLHLARRPRPRHARTPFRPRPQANNLICPCPSCLPARRVVSLPTTAWRRRLRGFHCGTPLTKATIAQGAIYAIAASYVHRAKTQEATGRPRRRRRRLFCHRRGTPNAVAAAKESRYEYVFTLPRQKKADMDMFLHGTMTDLCDRYASVTDRGLRALGPGPQIGHGVPADVGPEVDDRRQ